MREATSKTVIKAAPRFRLLKKQPVPKAKGVAKGDAQLSLESGHIEGDCMLFSASFVSLASKQGKGYGWAVIGWFGGAGEGRLFRRRRA